MNTRITVLYDNWSFDERLDPAWGFSCLIEHGGASILFDAGSDGAILRDNMRILGRDLREIQAVVLSHDHWDHMGGLWDVLRGTGPVALYYPKSLSDVFADHARKLGARPVGVERVTEVAPRLFAVPEMGRRTKEQFLLIEGERGVSVVTGCAHPGIVAIANRARRLSRKPVDLVCGGFHLKDAGPDAVDQVIQGLREAGVARVAPTHCTGAAAIAAFRDSWQGGFVGLGCGACLELS